MTTHSEIHSLPEPIRQTVRIGWVALALVSLWTFGWTLILTWEISFNPSARLAQGFADLGISAGLFFLLNAACLLITYLTHFTVAVLLFLRQPKDRMALFVAVFMMAFGTASAAPTIAEYLAVWSSDRLYYIIPLFINNILGWPFLVVFFALYPDGVFVPRRMLYVAVYGFIFSIFWGVYPEAFSAPTGWFAVLTTASIIIVFGGSLYSLIYRYRRYATALQRQQIKWMVYGFAVVAVVIVFQQLLIALFIANPDTNPADVIRVDFIVMTTGTILALIPIAVGIAILRYRLYDIDLLIRRTLTYSVITALLASIYFGGVVLLQNIFITFTGQAQSQLVTVISTLTIAAIFFPVRNQVQTFIDRRFYRHKYDAAKTLATFAIATRDEVDLETLTARLAQVIDDTLQPESTGMLLRISLPGVMENGRPDEPGDPWKKR